MLFSELLLQWISVQEIQITFVALRDLNVERPHYWDIRRGGKSDLVHAEDEN